MKQNTEKKKEKEKDLGRKTRKERVRKNDKVEDIGKIECKWKGFHKHRVLILISTFLVFTILVLTNVMLWSQVKNLMWVTNKISQEYTNVFNHSKDLESQVQRLKDNLYTVTSKYQILKKDELQLRGQAAKYKEIQSILNRTR